MSKLFNWLLQKVKQREYKRKSDYISKIFTHKKFQQLEALLGFSIKNREYFIQALMHRSFLEQNEEYDVSNERMEFLGDSVLSLIVADHLFDTFPDKDEGFLTKVRAKLVNRLALAEAAERIKLDKFILVGKNLANQFASGSKTILSDAFEALLGAIYLDNGLDSAAEFVNRVLIEPNTKEGFYLIDENFKSQLLEYTQANKIENPNYIVVKEEGPQHNRTFIIKVMIGNSEFGRGSGRNKKSAEQKAAQAALLKITQENLKNSSKE